MPRMHCLLWVVFFFNDGIVFLKKRWRRLLFAWPQEVVEMGVESSAAESWEVHDMSNLSWEVNDMSNLSWA